MDENTYVNENHLQQQHQYEQDRQAVSEAYNREITKHRTATNELNAAGKRGNADDSGYMRRVKETLTLVNEVLEQPMGESFEAFKGQVRVLSRNYADLIGACERYLSERKMAYYRLFTKGRTRYLKVAALLNIAKQERVRLADLGKDKELYELRTEGMLVGNALVHAVRDHSAVDPSLNLDENIWRVQGEYRSATVNEKKYTMSTRSGKKPARIANAATAGRLMNYMGADALGSAPSLVLARNARSVFYGIREQAKGERKTLSEMEAEQNEAVSVTYEPEALRQLSNIKMMRLLLGIEPFDAKKDIAFTYEKKNVGDGEVYLIKSAALCNFEHAFSETMNGRALQRQAEETSLAFADKELCEFIASMTKDDISYIAGDLLTKDRKKAFSQRLRFLQQKIEAQNRSVENGNPGRFLMYGSNDWENKRLREQACERIMQDRESTFAGLFGPNFHLSGKQGDRIKAFEEAERARIALEQQRRREEEEARIRREEEERSRREEEEKKRERERKYREFLAGEEKRRQEQLEKKRREKEEEEQRKQEEKRRQEEQRRLEEERRRLEREKEEERVRIEREKEEARVRIEREKEKERIRLEREKEEERIRLEEEEQEREEEEQEQAEEEERRKLKEEREERRRLREEEEQKEREREEREEADDEEENDEDNAEEEKSAKQRWRETVEKYKQQSAEKQAEKQLKVQEKNEAKRKEAEGLRKRLTGINDLSEIMRIVKEDNEERAKKKYEQSPDKKLLDSYKPEEIDEALTIGNDEKHESGIEKKLGKFYEKEAEIKKLNKRKFEPRFVNLSEKKQREIIEEETIKYRVFCERVAKPAYHAYFAIAKQYEIYMIKEKKTNARYEKQLSEAHRFLKLVYDACTNCSNDVLLVRNDVEYEKDTRAQDMAVLGLKEYKDTLDTYLEDVRHRVSPEAQEIKKQSEEFREARFAEGKRPDDTVKAVDRLTRDLIALRCDGKDYEEEKKEENRLLADLKKQGIYLNQITAEEFENIKQVNERFAYKLYFSYVSAYRRTLGKEKVLATDITNTLKQSGKQNHLALHGTCGPSALAQLINQIYGINITNAGLNVALLDKFSRYSMEYLRDVDEKGDALLEDSLRPDWSESGGTEANDLSVLLDIFGLEHTAVMREDTPAADSDEKRDKDTHLDTDLLLFADTLKRGGSVQVAIRSKILWSEGTRYGDDNEGVVFTTHWINLCGVRMHEGTLLGFEYKDTGNGKSGFVGAELLDKSYRGMVKDGTVVTVYNPSFILVNESGLQDEANRVDPDPIEVENRAVIKQLKDAVDAKKKVVDDFVRLFDDAIAKIQKPEDHFPEVLEERKKLMGEFKKAEQEFGRILKEQKAVVSRMKDDTEYKQIVKEEGECDAPAQNVFANWRDKYEKLAGNILKDAYRTTINEYPDFDDLTDDGKIETFFKDWEKDLAGKDYTEQKHLDRYRALKERRNRIQAAQDRNKELAAASKIDKSILVNLATYRWINQTGANAKKQMNALEKKIKSNHPEIFEKYQIPEEEKKEEKKEAKKEEVKA